MNVTRRLIFTGIILLLFTGGCQLRKKNPAPSFLIESYRGKPILVGRITPEDIREHIPEWRAEFLTCPVDTQAVNRFRQIKQDFRIVCILGIWCPDSREGVPPFVETVRRAENPHLKMEIYGVDRRKEDPTHSAQRFGVDRVPTFIIFSDKKEIGRMVEFPEDTFARDFLKIIRENRVKNEKPLN